MPLEVKIHLMGVTPPLRDELARELSGLTPDFTGTPEDSVACVVYFDGKLPKGAEKVLATQGPKTILLSTVEDKENINEILARYPAHHLVGSNGQRPLGEVATTIEKLATGDIFGLDKHLAKDARISTRVIRSASEIDPAIEEMLSELDLGAYFSATHEFLRLTANEFLTNAVYNAPVDDQGVPKYEKVDRKNKIKLSDAELVEITVASDEDHVAVSVVDRFGRLTREKMVQHFVKCVNNTEFVSRKEGGAGAGLYLAFYTANQYIVNVDPGRRLETICILEKNKRYKEYRTRITSFSFFKPYKNGGAA